MSLHNGKFLLGQSPGLVEDFLRDGPLAYVMEQGQGGIELDFGRSQRRNDSGGGEGTQGPLCQAFKLHAMGSMVHEQLLPAQDGKCRFNVQFCFTSTSIKCVGDGPDGPSLFSI